MSVNMSSAQQNNDAMEMFDHGGYDLSNQLDILLNGMSDSNIVKLTKTRCKELQEQYSNQHTPKKEQEANVHKNFYRLINETKPYDNSKNSLANESFHKPTEPVHFGRRAVPLGIDAEYENVIHSINESSLSHERWSTTRLPTTEETNRSYELNIELPLSDSKNRVNNNNNNNNVSSNSNDNLSAMNKNSKIINVERVTAGNENNENNNKDMLSAEYVERRRSRRPTITSVTISPLHHTHPHDSTSKDEFKMSQTYNKRISGKAKNTDAQTMKLPYIASNNAGVSTTTTSTKGAFATHKINKNENRKRPSVDLSSSLNNVRTQKVNSTHLAPMIRDENNKGVNNNNKNDNSKKDRVNNVINVNTATTSLLHPTLNTTKREAKAEEVAASTKLLSEEEGMYDLHHLISDAHDNNTDEHNINVNKTVKNVNQKCEIEKEIRETVPVGKVGAEIAKFNAKLTEDADDANNNIINKTNDRNSYVAAKNGVRNNVQQSLKETTADIKYNKTNTVNLVRNTYTGSSTNAADAITNSAADNNNINSAIIRDNKDASKEYNHSAAISHPSNNVKITSEKSNSKKYDGNSPDNVKQTSPQLHDNGFNDDKEDKCGLTTSRESSRRKSDNVNSAVVSLPLESTTHNINLTIKNAQDKDNLMELQKSKKQQPVLIRENVLHNEKNTNKVVNGDYNYKTDANAVTMYDFESKRYNTDKRHSSLKKEYTEEPAMRSRLSSRRVLMNATDTSFLSAEHSQKDAATWRDKLMA